MKIIPFVATAIALCGLVVAQPFGLALIGFAIFLLFLGRCMQADSHHDALSKQLAELASWRATGQPPHA